VLGHAFNEDDFTGIGGLVLGGEFGEQGVEVFLIFPIENFEFSGEAMAEIVLRNGGFALFRARTGRSLGVLLVGGDLRWGRHLRFSPEMKNASEAHRPAGVFEF